MISPVITNKEISRIIGKRIFVIRQIKGISQETITRKAHIDSNQILKYENGQNVIDIEILTKISKVLGLDIATLISGIISKK